MAVIQTLYRQALKQALLPALLGLSLLSQPAQAAELDVLPLLSLVTRSDGISCEGLEISAGGQALSGPAVAPGTTLMYRFRALRGFEDIAYEPLPSSSYRVELRLYENTDQIFGAGEDVIYNRELLAADPARQLGQGDSLSLELPLAQLPLIPGKAYRLSLSLRDMTDLNVLEVQHRFVYAQSSPAPASAPQREQAGIRLYPQGIEAAQVLSRQHQPDDQDGSYRLKRGEAIKLEFQQLSGFSVIDGKIRAGLEMTLLDSDGKVVLYYQDVLREQAEFEADAPIVTGLGIMGLGRYVWSLRLFDKRSGRQLGSRLRLLVDGPLFSEPF